MPLLHAPQGIWAGAEATGAAELGVGGSRVDVVLWVQHRFAHPKQYHLRTLCYQPLHFRACTARLPPVLCVSCLLPGLAMPFMGLSLGCRQKTFSCYHKGDANILEKVQAAQADATSS